MQRRAYVPGAALAAALLTAGLTGCSGGPDDGGAEDAKPGGPTTTAPAAQPGRYRTLPEPCGAVGAGTLRSLLPGIDSLEAEERKKAYDGQASITYDTDRRVGCRWKAETEAGTRHLAIDFERVVSYDPAVSDDDRAQELYDKKAAAADIPAVAPSGGAEEDGEGASASASESAADQADPAGTTGPSDASDPSADASADPSGRTGEGDETGEAGRAGKTGGEPGADSSESPSTDAGADPDTAPRPLDDLADIAYLDDRLATADSGVHRDIEVVFRVSNVIVTVQYDQWSALQADLPESQDLQSKAQRLAEELVGRISE
ncbi:hypothetical protein [Streptomyces sp. 8N706]|uniref:hypothetical protein n=1 Tax=Streptomyces sp. 8N706 TaxID=3457416 RepID=UPI003FD5436B